MKAHAPALSVEQSRPSKVSEKDELEIDLIDNMQLFLSSRSKRTRTFCKAKAREPNSSSQPLADLCKTGPRIIDDSSQPLAQVCAPTSETLTPNSTLLMATKQASAESLNLPTRSCMAGVKLLQNFSVRRVLLSERCIRLVECEEPCIDLLLDCSTAVIFIKYAVLPSAVKGTLPLIPNTTEAQGLEGGDDAPATLMEIIASERYDTFLIIVEQYTSSGFEVPETPPIQKAKAELVKKAKDLRRPPQILVQAALSPSHAAQLVREHLDKLQSCNFNQMDNAKGVDEAITVSDFENGREELLAMDEHPHAASLIPLLNPFASHLVLHTCGSLSAFLDMSGEERVRLFQQVLGKDRKCLQK
jgi:hypothetical protein